MQRPRIQFRAQDYAYMLPNRSAATSIEPPAPPVHTVTKQGLLRIESTLTVGRRTTPVVIIRKRRIALNRSDAT
jgi:hypothetical protein